MIHIAFETSSSSLLSFSFLAAAVGDLNSKRKSSTDVEEDLPGNLVCCIPILMFLFGSSIYG